MNDQNLLLKIKQAKAVFAFGYLIVDVSGNKSSACHNVDIEQSFLTGEPSTFLVTQTLPSGVRLTTQIEPFQVSKAFFIGEFRDTIQLNNAEEIEHIPVGQSLTPDHIIRTWADMLNRNNWGHLAF